MCSESGARGSLLSRLTGVAYVADIVARFLVMEVLWGADLEIAEYIDVRELLEKAKRR